MGSGTGRVTQAQWVTTEEELAAVLITAKRIAGNEDISTLRHTIIGVRLRML
jgi:hypothetical protein